jgi:hypothetical protein
MKVLPAEFDHNTSEIRSRATSQWFIPCLMVLPGPGTRNRMDTLPIEMSVLANCWNRPERPWGRVGRQSACVRSSLTFCCRPLLCMSQFHPSLCMSCGLFSWFYHDALPARILLSPPWKLIRVTELAKEGKRSKLGHKTNWRNRELNKLTPWSWALLEWQPVV